jgi:hypothetical protein
MLENKEYESPPLEIVIENFKKWPSGGINLDILSEAIKENKLTAEQLTGLNSFFVTGYIQAMDSCFPGNAFDNLRGQNMIADYIPPQESLDLDKEWANIHDLLKLEKPADEMSTSDILKHIAKFKADDFPNFEEIVQTISSYIGESIRRAHKENDPARLQKVIPAFKLLVYFRKKLRGAADYGCEAEFDRVVRFGVDLDKMGFRYLQKDELKEKLMGPY